jgi:hypothetical protein
VPLIRRGGIALPFEDMAQMATTIAADDLCSLHTYCAIRMSRHSAWNGIEVRGPTTARLELVVRFVERRIAACAGIDSSIGHVLVVFTGAWGFGAFFSEDSELFCSHLLVGNLNLQWADSTYLYSRRPAIPGPTSGPDKSCWRMRMKS